MIIEGRVWTFGDDVDTDAIIPARYLNTSDPQALAEHCMEDADPDFPCAAEILSWQARTSVVVAPGNMQKRR